MGHMSSCLLFSDHHYAFRKGSSSALQLIDIIDKWTKATDKGDSIDRAYFDFAKVFDTVLTKRLMAKFHPYVETY